MEKIDVLHAELLATRVMVTALAVEAVNRPAVCSLFDIGVNKLMSEFLPSNVDQEFLDLVQTHLARYRALVASA